MTAPTLTLADFLLARIADDEARAVNCHDLTGIMDGYGQQCVVDFCGPGKWACACPMHARLHAEREAKRRIVGLAGYSERRFSPAGTASNETRYFALCALAEVYADHPDYREEWRP